MTQTGAVRTAIYCRISQDRSGAAAGVERQREDCARLAAERGWSVVEVFVDNDLSAFARSNAGKGRGKARPGYAAMVEAMRAGRLDAVVVWHPDRLYRRITDLEALVDDLDNGRVQVLTVRAGRVDLSTASGRLNARLLGTVAMYESEIKSERIARAAQQRAAAGRFSGGMRPYGYEPDGVTVRDCEAVHLRQAYADVTAGLSLAAAARRMAQAGALSSTGKGWTAARLRSVLLSPRFVGRATHQGAVVADAVWPPIVDPNTWETVRAILSDPARRTTPGNQPRHLLSGITTCGREGCGRLCRVSTTGGKGRARRLVYRCPRGHVIRSKKVLEDYVVNLTLRAFDREQLTEPEPVPDAGTQAGPGHAASDLRARLDALAVDYAEGILTREQFHTGTATIRARLDELDAQTAAHTRQGALADLRSATTAREGWEQMDQDQRRAAIRELWRITLMPQPVGFRGIDPDSVILTPVQPGPE